MSVLLKRRRLSFVFFPAGLQMWMCDLFSIVTEPRSHVKNRKSEYMITDEWQHVERNNMIQLREQ